jgi:hypothetical protein
VTHADVQSHAYWSDPIYPEHGIDDVRRSRKALLDWIDLTDDQVNGDTLPADQTFTMQLAVQGMVMGTSYHPTRDHQGQS